MGWVTLPQVSWTRTTGGPAGPGAQVSPAGQIQLLNHIRESQELYGMTWPARTG
jgi:hypothetical protein